MVELHVCFQDIFCIMNRYRWGCRCFITPEVWVNYFPRMVLLYYNKICELSALVKNGFMEPILVNQRIREITKKDKKDDYII